MQGMTLHGPAVPKTAAECTVEKTVLWAPTAPNFGFKIPDGGLKCPLCQSIMRNCDRWYPHGPRRVVALESCYYVLASMHRCDRCKKNFPADSEAVLSNMPVALKEMYPCITSHQDAYCKGSTQLLRRFMATGQGADAFADCVRELHAGTYARRALVYYAHGDRLDPYQKTQRKLPNGQYWVQAYLRDFESRKDETEKLLSTTLEGTSIRMDHTTSGAKSLGKACGGKWHIARVYSLNSG